MWNIKYIIETNQTYSDYLNVNESYILILIKYYILYELFGEKSLVVIFSNNMFQGESCGFSIWTNEIS